MYKYIKSESKLWTVGFFNPDGKWEPESDHGTKKEASERVIVLNGGTIPTPSKEESSNGSIDSKEWIMVEGVGNTRITDTNGRNICSTFSESDEFASLIASAPQLQAENAKLKGQNNKMKGTLETLDSILSNWSAARNDGRYTNLLDFIHSALNQVNS